MSVSSQITALMNALADFQATVKTVLTKKPAAASAADNALALGGSAAASYPAAAKNLADTHIANKSNPHNLTTSILGAYNKTEVDAFFAQKLPAGVLPLSRFGSLDYLPVSAAGSYESGTNIGGYAYMDQPLLLERDGTLTWLRNGTDGSTQGVYYSYMKNAKTANVNAVFTNRRYRPSFIPAGKEVWRVFSGNKDVLIGEVRDVGATTGRQVFIAFTNGTMDDTKHTGGLIPTSVYDPSILSTHYSVEPILAGSVLYMVYGLAGVSGSNASDPYELKLFKINVSDIVNNTVTAWSLVTGWNVTGAKSTKTGATNIRLADKIASTVGTDDAVFITPSSGVFGSEYAASWGNGCMTKSFYDQTSGKIRVNVWHGFRMNPSASASLTSEVMLSVVIDPVAMTAVLDAPFVGGCSVTFNGGLNGLVFSNTAYSAAGRWIDNGGYIYGGKNYHVTDDGYVFMVFMSNITEQTNYLVRYKLTASQKPYDMLPTTGLVATYNAVAIGAVGPSPFMNGYRGVSLLPNGYLLGVSEGTGTWQRAVGKYKNAGETPSFAYKSVSGADQLGYSPKADRKLAGTLGGYTASTYLTEIDQSGNITASRLSILWSSSLSRPLTIDENLATSGTISVDATVLSNAAAAAYTAAGYTGTAKNILAQLIVPGDASAPCVLCIWAIQPDGTQCTAVFTVAVGARSGVVGSVSLVNLAGKYAGPITANTTFTVATTDLVPGSTYTKMPEGYAITIGGFGRWAKSGSSTINSFKLFVNTDGSIEGFASLEYAPEYSAVHYFAMPGLGVGTLRNDTPDSDYYTKLLFQPNATTKSDFVTWPAKTRSDKVVILSQQVPAGWSVYFTDPTPVVMKGTYGQLAPASFDLTTIQADPSNTTFFVYVDWSGATPTYQITTTEQDESASKMYIGKIVTGATQITSMQIGKVSRIGNYRVSQTPVGSAIPASTGNPTQAVQLAAGWKP